MYLRHVIIGVLTSLEFTSGWNFSECGNRSDDNANGPLLLTPLIRSGKIKEARRLAVVPPLVRNMNSDAGYLSTSQGRKSHLFFWFCRHNGPMWSEAPVILWLQGGPGCSSMFALFNENGPLVITKTGDAKRRNYAWTNYYNVLYIDQPVGTGYSFTENDDGFVSNRNESTNHLHEALIQFFQMYPELSDNEFYIAGESYAAKFVITLAHKIHLNSLNETEGSSFNLCGLFIVSGFFEPPYYMYYAEFLHIIGLIDYPTRQRMQILEEEMRFCTRAGLWLDANAKWTEVINLTKNTTQFTEFYDYKQENWAGDRKYIKFITSNKIRKSIHVGNQWYNPCSKEVKTYLQVDIMSSVKTYVEILLEHYPIVFYGGQRDITSLTAYPLIKQFLENVQWTGAESYTLAKREMLFVDKNLVGYYKVAGNLKDVMIRNAGHFVPEDYPKVTLYLLNMFIDRKL